MKIVRSVTELNRDTNSVVTIGTFDGVHLAHQEIVREVVNRARTRHGRSVVITFDPHPKEVVTSAKGPVRLLSTIDERVQKLQSLNVDVLLIITFTLEFSRLSSNEFYQQYVVNPVGLSEVVVGYDHMFGRDREAGIQELVKLGQELDFSVFAVHPYAVDGELVSSTRIRRALAEGNLERARKFLGYNYALSGVVVSGDGRGKGLGYPTANIKPASEKKMIPARGVYLVGVELEQGQYFGMLNIGVRPTVTQQHVQTIEVHVFDFSHEMYGKQITVTFLKRLREEQRFASVTELVSQLRKDKELSLKYIAEQQQRT